MTIDIIKLENLLEENDLTGARSLIAEFITQPMSEEEKGEALVNLAFIYLNICNTANEDYKAVLADALTSLKKIDKEEGKANDEIRLEKLNQELGV